MADWVAIPRYQVWPPAFVYATVGCPDCPDEMVLSAITHHLATYGCRSCGTTVEDEWLDRGGRTSNIEYTRSTAGGTAAKPDQPAKSFGTPLPVDS